jgi:hypothetical protein
MDNSPQINLRGRYQTQRLLKGKLLAKTPPSKFPLA